MRRAVALCFSSSFLVQSTRKSIVLRESKGVINSASLSILSRNFRRSNMSSSSSSNDVGSSSSSKVESSTDTDPTDAKVFGLQGSKKARYQEPIAKMKTEKVYFGVHPFKPEELKGPNPMSPPKER